MNSQIQFYLNNTDLTEKYILPKVLIHEATKQEFILGLNFMLSLDGQINITKHYATLSKQTTLIPTNKHQSLAKHGGQTTTLFLENIDDNTELEISLYLLKCYKSFDQQNSINIQNPLQKIFQLAEETHIIGKNPIQHWDKNKEYAELQIINPYLIIKTNELE